MCGLTGTWPILKANCRNPRHSCAFRTGLVSTCVQAYTLQSRVYISEVILIDRILNDILRYSSLVMSDYGLLPKPGSFHRRKRCELFIIAPSVLVRLRISVITIFLFDSLSQESSAVHL